MKLDSIKSGLEVFIDANIFIYHFTGVSDESSDFLSKCEHGILTGITSANIILEVLHRLMMIEAVRKKMVKPPNIIRKLRKSPKKIKQLNEYFINTRSIIEMGIAIKSIAFEAIIKSQTIRTRYGLMVNDSLIVASMQEEGIKALATNDDAFSKIEGLFGYMPTDVKLS